MYHQYETHDMDELTNPQLLRMDNASALSNNHLMDNSSVSNTKFASCFTMAMWRVMSAPSRYRSWTLHYMNISAVCITTRNMTLLDGSVCVVAVQFVELPFNKEHVEEEKLLHGQAARRGNVQASR